MPLRIVTQNVQHGAAAQNRWAGLAAAISELQPQLVMLQEVDWLTNPAAIRAAEWDLGLRLLVAQSRHMPTAIAWDSDRLTLRDSRTDTKHKTWHGFCLASFDVVGVDLPRQLVAISAHLNPSSAAAAAIEAQIIGTRAYQHDGLGVIAGDINHPPLGDPEPDWTKIQPYNRMARCLPVTSPDDPWQANTIVGQTLYSGGFTDVAAHIADQNNDPTLRQPTGKHGGIRADQILVTPALRRAIAGSFRRDTTAYTDHHAVGADIDLAQADLTQLREYT
jgi:endonuclease/exonuclease/phosphatase family metal-dependent hydrolase